MTRYLGARSGRPRQQRTFRPELPPRKEHAPCCTALRDQLGRLPIGFCGPRCQRRPDWPWKLTG